MREVVLFRLGEQRVVGGSGAPNELAFRETYCSLGKREVCAVMGIPTGGGIEA